MEVVQHRQRRRTPEFRDGASRRRRVRRVLRRPSGYRVGSELDKPDGSSGSESDPRRRRSVSVASEL